MFSRRYCFYFCFTCSSSIEAKQIEVLSRVKIVISSRKVKHSEMTDKRYVTSAFRQAAVCALITKVPFGDIGWARLLIEANSTQTDGIAIVRVVFLRESTCEEQDEHFIVTQFFLEPSLLFFFFCFNIIFRFTNTQHALVQ